MVSVQPDMRLEHDTDGRSRWHDERRITLSDVRALQGERSNVVVTPLGGGVDEAGNEWIMTGSRPFEFQVGHRYLIVATRDDGRLVVNGGLTRPIGEAGELVDYVRSFDAPSAGGRVWGSVSVSHLFGPREVEGVAGARMVFDGPVTGTVTTDANGRFSVRELPEGRYILRTILPDGRSGLQPIADREVVLAGAYACAEVEIFTSIGGRIAGTVFDTTGSPRANVMVSLGTEGSADAELRVATDSLGRYAFSDVLPGRYVIGLGIFQGPVPPDDVAVSFATRGGSREIDLGGGEHISLDPITASPLDRMTVRGEVRWPDGKPASSTLLTFAAVVDGRAIGQGRRAFTDVEGRFAVELYADLTYRVQARSGADVGAFAEIIAVQPSVTIVLQRP